MKNIKVNIKNILDNCQSFAGFYTPPIRYTIEKMMIETALKIAEKEIKDMMKKI